MIYLKYLFVVEPLLAHLDLGACNRARMCNIPKLFLAEEKSALQAAIGLSGSTLSTSRNQLGKLHCRMFDQFSYRVYRLLIR